MQEEIIKIHLGSVRPPTLVQQARTISHGSWGQLAEIRAAQSSRNSPGTGSSIRGGTSTHLRAEREVFLLH